MPEDLTWFKGKYPLIARHLIPGEVVTLRAMDENSGEQSPDFHVQVDSLSEQDPPLVGFIAQAESRDPLLELQQWLDRCTAGDECALHIIDSGEESVQRGVSVLWENSPAAVLQVVSREHEEGLRVIVDLEHTDAVSRKRTAELRFFAHLIAQPGIH